MRTRTPAPASYAALTACTAVRRVDDRTRGAGIDQHVRDLDRHAGVRQRRGYERELMPKRQLHEVRGSPPQALFEFELHLAGVHEAELTIGVRAAKLTVSLHRRTTIPERLDDTDAIEDPLVVRAVRFERFHDEPLIGMRRADLAPPQR